MREIRVSQQAVAQPLSRYLRGRFPGVAQNIWRKAFAQRDVKRGGVRLGPNDLVGPGDVLAVFISDAYLDAPLEINVVYEDAQIAVVDKPVDLSCQEDGRDGPTLEKWAATKWAGALLCHRLDHDTRGLVMIGKDQASYEEVCRALGDERVIKKYRAIVRGNPGSGDEHAFLIKDARAARVSIVNKAHPAARAIHTSYVTLKSVGPLSLVEITLHTGRTHQIRAHMAHLGYPLLGDDLYGSRALNKQYNVFTQQLMAYSLAFSSLFDLGGKLITLDAHFTLEGQVF